MTVRTITARYAGTCGDCGTKITVGDLILYGGRGRVAHAGGDCTLDNVAAGPTTRERKEARAERLRDWADGRAAKATAAHTTAHAMADVIPFGQPIMVGHYSEGRDRGYRARMHGQMEKAFEHGNKADSMRSRAANIEAAADRAIYSDDPDAVERLTERIAELEAERDRWKAYNAACRKAKGQTADALAILTERERAGITGAHVMLRVYGQAPSYHVTNLSGNIGRYRKRLAVALADVAGVRWISDAQDALRTALAVWNTLGFVAQFGK